MVIRYVPVPVMQKCVLMSTKESQRQLDLLLHPRLPPLITATPLVENLSLVFSEESLEETELRKSLGLFTMQDRIQQNIDTEMSDPTNPPPQSTPVSKIIPSPTAPNHSTSSKYDGGHLSQIKVATPPEPTPTPVQETAERPSSGSARPTITEPPKSQAPKPAPQVPQVELSDHLDQGPSIPTNRILDPSVEADEDEEMPAIDLESDSDME